MKTVLRFGLAMIFLLSFAVFIINYSQCVGECGENLSWKLNPFNGQLTISGEGDMYDYNDGARKAPWKSRGVLNVETVVIEKGVTSVGKYAFSGMDIDEIWLPDGLESIDEAAFYYSELENVQLPESLVSVGKLSFAKNPLKEIVVPEKVKRIDYGAFSECYLERATVKGKITVLQDSVFYGCEKLEALSLPSSLNEIRQGALGGCEKLKSIAFEGTEEQWKRITVNPDYNQPVMDKANVMCSIKNN